MTPEASAVNPMGELSTSDLIASIVELPTKDIPPEVTAQEFLDIFDNGTIPEGITVKITDGTQGSFVGDFNVIVAGQLEFGENISLDVSGLFELDGTSSDPEAPSGSQLGLGENTRIQAGSLEWLIDGNLQVKMNNTITTTQGDLVIKAGNQIQLEEDIFLHAADDLELVSRDDGEIQIKKVESIENPNLPNISAGGDILIHSSGDIQIQEGNLFQAGGKIELMGTSDEGDIEIGSPLDPTSPMPVLSAGGSITMETNGDIQIQSGNRLYAGRDIRLTAKSEGDVQVQQIDQPLAGPRFEAGGDVIFEAEGDINFQRGDAVEPLSTPDIQASDDIIMTAIGEVEVEPGNWLLAGDTIQLQTIGVEVQVQPRDNTTLEAGSDILLLALEENAGITVGGNDTLIAGRNITLISGQKDQGEGDTRVKENSTLVAGGSLTIESGRSGQTEVKENSVLSGGDITVASGDEGETVVKENNSLAAEDLITITSGVKGETVVDGSGTTLSAQAVTLTTGNDGQLDIDSDVVIRAPVSITISSESLIESSKKLSGVLP
jgi:hypothetical protein